MLEESWVLIEITLLKLWQFRQDKQKACRQSQGTREIEQVIKNKDIVCRRKCARRNIQRSIIWLTPNIKEDATTVILPPPHTHTSTKWTIQHYSIKSSSSSSSPTTNHFIPLLVCLFAFVRYYTVAYLTTTVLLLFVSKLFHDSIPVVSQWHKPVRFTIFWIIKYFISWSLFLYCFLYLNIYVHNRYSMNILWNRRAYFLW